MRKKCIKVDLPKKQSSFLVSNTFSLEKSILLVSTITLIVFKLALNKNNKKNEKITNVIDIIL